MVSLFMGQLTSNSVPADEAVVRRTATPANVNAAPAVMDNQPEPQEVETDSNPDLGMNTRQLASAWTEGRRGTPVAGREDITGSMAQINSQVASSGTAASREAAGVSNKNLSYAIGIEPVGDLSGAGGFGNEYFVRNDREIQETMGREMSIPPGYDSQTTQQVAEAGKQGARAAGQATSIYDLFWNGGK
jgi:hypothetical protein